MQKDLYLYFFLNQQSITWSTMADHSSYFVTMYKRTKQYEEREEKRERKKREEREQNKKKRENELN